VNGSVMNGSGVNEYLMNESAGKESVVDVSLMNMVY